MATLRDPNDLKLTVKETALRSIRDVFRGLYSVPSAGVIQFNSAAPQDSNGYRLSGWQPIATYTDTAATSRTLTLSGFAGITNYADLKLSIRRWGTGTDDKVGEIVLNGDTTTSIYSWHQQYTADNTANSSVGDAAAELIQVGHTGAGNGLGTGTGEVFWADLIFKDWQDTTKYKQVAGKLGGYEATPRNSQSRLGATYKSSNALTSIALSMESGGTYSAIITLSGRRNAA